MRPRAVDESSKSQAYPPSPALLVRPRRPRRPGQAPGRPTVPLQIERCLHRRQQRNQVRSAHSSRRLSSQAPRSRSMVRRRSDRHKDRAACDRARHWLRVLSGADKGNRRRPLAGRPRERLDDDAARWRQTLGRHPRREFSHSQFNRRGTRCDCGSHGGNRSAARLAYRQASGRQRRWECERIFS